MRYRITKPNDCGEVARLVLVCEADQQEKNFTFQLGFPFLKQYYRLALEEKNAVAICGLGDDDRIIGFVMGTLDAAESLRTFRRHPVRLGCAALRGILGKPFLLPGLIARFRSASSAGSGSEYVVSSGARCTYWGVLPEGRPHLGGVRILEKWLELMRLIGAREIRLEVDKEHPTSHKCHQLLGAKVIKEFSTPDGRSRLIMEYPAPQGG
jgi:hypothetical protein